MIFCTMSNAENHQDCSCMHIEWFLLTNPYLAIGKNSIIFAKNINRTKPELYVPYTVHLLIESSNLGLTDGAQLTTLLQVWVNLHECHFHNILSINFLEQYMDMNFNSYRRDCVCVYVDCTLYLCIQGNSAGR